MPENRASEGTPSPATPAGLAAFHAHLDVCKQCGEQPFNLCATGGILIQAAVDEPLPAWLTSLRNDHV